VLIPERPEPPLYNFLGKSSGLPHLSGFIAVRRGRTQDQTGRDPVHSPGIPDVFMAEPFATIPRQRKDGQVPDNKYARVLVPERPEAPIHTHTASPILAGHCGRHAGLEEINGWGHAHAHHHCTA
jgi:hypothetical protein